MATTIGAHFIVETLESIQAQSFKDSNVPLLMTEERIHMKLLLQYSEQDNRFQR
jgi:hypothetical protein